MAKDMTKDRRIALDRRKVVARVLKDREDALVVTGLGAPSFDAMAAGDHPHNFYIWGGMGGAVSLGPGLACAQPRRRVLAAIGRASCRERVGPYVKISVVVVSLNKKNHKTS